MAFTVIAAIIAIVLVKVQKANIIPDKYEPQKIAAKKLAERKAAKKKKKMK